MTITTQTLRQDNARVRTRDAELQDVIETRLWLEEHDWLYRLLRSDRQCVADLPLPRSHQRQRLAGLRAFTMRRQSHLPVPRYRAWYFARPTHRAAANRCGGSQYQLLLDLQRSPANRHPNPKFQLDQLTTACVALCRAEDGSGSSILRQARRNMAERSHHGQDAPPG
jgi:hypothetical protein